MTHPLTELRDRLGRQALEAAVANNPTVEVSRPDLRAVLCALDELIEPAAKREPEF